VRGGSTPPGATSNKSGRLLASTAPDDCADRGGDEYAAGPEDEADGAQQTGEETAAALAAVGIVGVRDAVERQAYRRQQADRFEQKHAPTAGSEDRAGGETGQTNEHQERIDTQLMVRVRRAISWSRVVEIAVGLTILGVLIALGWLTHGIR
jgi:hypothetical protein